MDKRKLFKIGVITLITVTVLVGVVGYYMFNMPHRDVQKASTDYAVNASEIVSEYLSNPGAANEKYLDSEGESKILEIKGIISKIEEDFENNKVILLKSETDKAGVSCTLLPDQVDQISNLNLGDEISIKGVIRAGAAFDEDLNMFENVIVEKSSLVSKN